MAKRRAHGPRGRLVVTIATIVGGYACSAGIDDAVVERDGRGAQLVTYRQCDVETRLTDFTLLPVRNVMVRDPLTVSMWDVGYRLEKDGGHIPERELRIEAVPTPLQDDDVAPDDIFDHKETRHFPSFSDQPEEGLPAFAAYNSVTLEDHEGDWAFAPRLVIFDSGGFLCRLGWGRSDCHATTAGFDASWVLPAEHLGGFEMQPLTLIGRTFPGVSAPLFVARFQARGTCETRSYDASAGCDPDEWGEVLAELARQQSAHLDEVLAQELSDAQARDVTWIVSIDTANNSPTPEQQALVERLTSKLPDGVKYEHLRMYSVFSKPQGSDNYRVRLKQVLAFNQAGFRVYDLPGSVLAYEFEITARSQEGLRSELRAKQKQLQEQGLAWRTPNFCNYNPGETFEFPP